MRETVAEKLFTVEQIQARVKELGRQLSADYADKNPLMVVVLKGSAMFAADLFREMAVDLQIDYIGTSSYGDSTESSGHVRIVKDIGVSLEGRHVVLIEDIVDTGLTLDYLLRTLSLREPASLKICAFLDKPSRRKVPVPVTYVGFSIEDHFVVGYGLDYASRYRQLPYIGILQLSPE
jgi:hypoxanthine phosphoribosyltransferase